METQTKPVPVDHASTKYPFATMKKGDEWEIPEQSEAGAIKVRNASGQFKIRKQPTWKLSVKPYTDGKYRCKRVK